jgi:predicted secreted protein
MKKSVIIILVIFLFSCNSRKEIEADYGVSKDGILEISLKSNPTTPFSWYWIKNDASKLVDSIDVFYIRDKAPLQMNGVGGTQIWKFKGKKNGIDTLIFQYCRFREPESTIEIKRIIVKIK